MGPYSARRRPRGLPRREGTVWLYLNRVRPALLDWSENYDHLREVTRDDVLAHVKTLHGRHRHDQLVALRSLFAWAKRSGLVFRNPTSRIKVGRYECAISRGFPPVGDRAAGIRPRVSPSPARASTSRS